MTQYLPPNLLALFAPREPIPFLAPPDKLPHEKKSRGYLGVGAFLGGFEDPKDTPPPTRVETREERLERRRREKAEQVAYNLEREIALWDPHQVKHATEDPFRTLFVSRINYDTSEAKLRREFEMFGAIKKIILVHNTEDGKPRGYAFIEYEHERDMHSAYKHADGKKIDGKRVLVDVERARTVKGWLPRRLGGGLGGTRRGGPDVNIKHSGREDNERERERYRLEREREDRDRGRGGAAGGPDRDRGDRGDRRRSRSPRERRERSMERHRSKSKERKRRRSREREGYYRPEVANRRDRDDDRDRNRRRKRSRSRDRNDRKKERRDKDRGDRGERKERKPEFKEGEIKIKEEPIDDYPDYTAQFSEYQTQIKYEDDENEEKYRPNPNGYSPGNEYD